jgi:two-component system response regulator AlgR
MLNILIADDEAPARARLQGLLEDCAADLPNRVVGEAATGLEVVDLLSRMAADVVLLDIQMPGMNGLETARHLHRLTPPPAVIFVTAYDEYALQAFEVRAMDYLLKPVRQARLLEALRRVAPLTATAAAGLAEIAPHRTHFSVNERGRLWLVPVADVLYLRAELKYVTARTREREYVLDDALVKLAEELEGDFLRIHRNCLVAKRHLTGFSLVREQDETRWVALLKDWPEHLPVSRRQAHVIRDFRQT